MHETDCDSSGDKIIDFSITLMFLAKKKILSTEFFFSFLFEKFFFFIRRRLFIPFYAFSDKNLENIC